jgi:RES domain
VNDPGELGDLWRVGYHADPLNFTPKHLYSWSHRFDDVDQAFRSAYVARRQETALREVLADLRPNTAAVARYVAIFGDEALEDLESEPITAAWRRSNVLVPARVVPDDAAVVDLIDPAQTREVEVAHAQLLAEHGMEHLDLHEITTRRRIVTQTIASDVYRRLGAGVIRFASSRDGNPCFAILEGHAALERTGEEIPLTDPPPDALAVVAAECELALEPTPG